MDELTALRKLATRLLATQFLYDPNSQSLRIYVGRLPDNLPVTIPVPDGGEVIGSVGGDPGEPVGEKHPPRTAILFDTSMQPDQVRDYYRDRLLADGWTMPDFPSGPGSGFTYGESADPDAVRALFCRSTRGPALWINAHKTDGPTNVLLEIEPGVLHSPCAPRRNSEARRTGVRGRIPPLVPPAGGNYLGMWGGASSGPDVTHSTAGVETALDLSAVVTHYTTQLEKGGWMRRDAGQDGALAWSTWTFHDEAGDNWDGVLYITQRPDAPHQFMLQIRAEWVRAGA